MSTSRFLSVLLFVVMALAALSGLVAAQGDQPAAPDVPISAAFSYQGSLRWGGAPASGAFDFQFILTNAASGGSQVGATVTLQDVAVSNGNFTVQLDFGAAAFDGQARWLQVGVRPGASTGAYTILSPRNALTAVPYALYARNAWSLTGNAGTTPGANFLGTTDNQALELKVNGQRALRLEPATSGSAFGPNVIAGHAGNSVASGQIAQTIAGGGSNALQCGTSGTAPCTNEVTNGYGTVGGGGGNTAIGDFATVGGGNANTADDRSVTIAGGEGNTAGDPVYTWTGNYATVGGGYGNTATGEAATIGGGINNTASFNRATVAGGGYNTASNAFATVGGGQQNEATQSWATVGGGWYNRASSSEATVGGGLRNSASGGAATVGGGEENRASGGAASVGGGRRNTASGGSATIPGGYFNTASGNASFAAGWRANAGAQGAFVWADSTDLDFDPLNFPEPGGRDNSFNVRATGGVYLVTAVDPTTGRATAGVYVSGGGSGWNVYSDRAAKENFSPADGRALLDRLAGIPIETWNYKTQTPSIRHIGPMAQDFYAAFGVGEDDTHISTIDADGVALAAIQGLYQVVQEKEAQIAAQEAEIGALKAQNSEIERRLAALERQAVAVIDQCTLAGGGR